MLYYQGYTVSFQEVPDEISLVISIADCPHRCPGCHSPQLQKPEGRDLLPDLPKMIREYGDVITCVCFMGEGQDDIALSVCHDFVKALGYKTCMYAGGADLHGCDWDYFKAGPYIESRGPLTSRTTNQRMFRLDWKAKSPDEGIIDITDRFWNKSIPL